MRSLLPYSWILLTTLAVQALSPADLYGQAKAVTYVEARGLLSGSQSYEHSTRLHASLYTGLNIYSDIKSVYK